MARYPCLLNKHLDFKAARLPMGGFFLVRHRYQLAFRNFSTTALYLKTAHVALFNLGGCYDIAKRQLNPTGPVFDSWIRYCEDHFLPFNTHLSVLPPDDTTLFATSGMQKHKLSFRDPTLIGHTISDVQRCLRLNDLAEIDDNRHHLVFHMMGLFSFRDWSVERGIKFWYQFLRTLNVPLTHVTVHPDCLVEWSRWHQFHNLPVVADPECRWSDGGISGYCTEFFVGELEVGNIVNPLGSCLDVGFGLERLEQATGGQHRGNGVERLQYTLDVLADSGVLPGPKTQGYVMRRLLRSLRERGAQWEHPLWELEVRRHENQLKLFQRLHKRNLGKDATWWWDTHGIILTDMF